MPRKFRHDGWTNERQQAFIDALADTGSVRHAAERINMSPEGAYYLRRQPGADSFAAAWKAAVSHGVQSLVDIAIDRAREGVLVPVYSYGKLVGQRRVFNDRLLMFLIKHHIGRLGGEDGAPLHPGTRSPETRARDEAEQKERWFEESKQHLLDAIGREAAALRAMALKLREHLQREAELRAAGNATAADQRAAEADFLIRLLGQQPGNWAINAHMTGLLAFTD